MTVDMSIPAAWPESSTSGKPKTTRRVFLKNTLASGVVLSAGSVALRGAPETKPKGRNRRSSSKHRRSKIQGTIPAPARRTGAADAQDVMTPGPAGLARAFGFARISNVMLPLAVVYATPGEGNSHYKDARLLDVIMKAGDALIDDMDEHGQWEFRKKDGSTWGKISMPWTYSRWIRTYGLIRDDMPAERRARWVQAFDRGFSHIEKTQLGHIHNIPAHHAMSLYIAGKELDRAGLVRAGDAVLARRGQGPVRGRLLDGGRGPAGPVQFRVRGRARHLLQAVRRQGSPACHRTGHPLSQPLHLPERPSRGND